MFAANSHYNNNKNTILIFTFVCFYSHFSGFSSLSNCLNGIANTNNNNNSTNTTTNNSNNNGNSNISTATAINNNNNNNVLNNNNVDGSSETACTNRGEQPDPDFIKMFVGQVPKSMDEDQLREMFEEFGRVHSINVLRDKVTGVSKGEYNEIEFLHVLCLSSFLFFIFYYYLWTHFI